MNKADFVKAVAEKADCTQIQAKDAVDAVLAAIKDALVQGETVQIVGFGNFSVKDVPARQATKPGTKEKIDVPAKKVVKFKAGKELADAVN